jgi:TolA-binding protein
MASSRLIFTALGALYVGTIALRASGDDYDAVPLALDYYLERIPAKSVSEIYAEMGPPASTAKPIELPREKLIHDFAQGPSPNLVAEIDQLLAASRAPYAGPTQVNLLQDLRDLAGNTQATGAEMSTYVKWRLDHVALFNKAEVDPYEKPTVPATGLPDIEAQAKLASPALLPHWLFLEGAFYYKNGDDTNSETYFNRVLSEFPTSARAEAALFMQARCRLSQSVKQDDDGTGSDPTTRDAAKALFQSYLTKYPQGRYTSDVIGWLGGVAYRSADPATALDYYTQQLETKEHPENFGAALVMIEKVLARQRPDNDATLDKVAEHPPVALALAYFALNFTQPKDSDTDTDYATFNKWRHGVLPKLGDAVLRHKELYQGAAWQDRYLAILAHAASDHGDQKQALDLINIGGKSGAPGDDYLFAKALVLQRAGQSADAEKTYRELLAKFPQSPLAAGAGYRLALALHDQKRDGEALLELASLRGNHLSLRALPQESPAQAQADQDADNAESALGIDYSGAPDQQIVETMDAILNFAPLPELEKALNATTDKAHAEFRTDLAQVLQERYLDHDDFRNAARFTDLPQAKAKWAALAAKGDALDKATGPDVAKGAMEMADFWVANRIQLPALPLDSLDTRGGLSFDTEAATDRAANAALLSYAQPEVELESRDGLWHAIKWWGMASATHDPVAAPTALWSIVKARRTIAEVNSYTWSRAISGGAGPDSKADYDAILAKYPDSPEAKHTAVYWTFAGNFARGDYERFAVGFDRDTLSADWLTAMNIPADPYDYNAEQSNQNLITKLEADAAQADDKSFAQEVEKIRTQVTESATFLEEADSVNCVNDLAQFAEVPNISPATRAQYVKARYQLVFGTTNESGASEPGVDLDALRKMPGATDVADFIDFLDLARTAGTEIDVPVKDLDKDGQPLTFGSRDYQGLLAKTTAFLAKYPKSVKREAARLLQIRALVRLSRPREVAWSLDWPAVNQWDDAYTPRFLTLAPFDPKTVNAAFRAYDAEFPHGQGHYTNAVLALRADTELIQQHWDNALDNILALLDQQTAPELHVGAAGELAYIFDQLDKDERREPVLTEILKRPAARTDLTSYIKTGGLPRLADYLNAKLAAAH